MKKNLYKFFVLLLLSLFVLDISNAQPPSVYWERFYGGSKVDYLGFIQKTFDNGFAIAGHGQSKDGDLTVISSGGASDFELIRLDSCGNRKWGKLIGGNFLEIFSGITETTDHGFLLTGNTTSTNLTNGFHGGVVDAVICKIDAAGNLQWIKTFGGSLNDYFYKAISLPDSSCIVTGFTTSLNGDGNPLGDSENWLVKLDKNGNIIWKKFPPFGGYDIKATNDGNLILCGDGITKIDTSGSLVWHKDYGSFYSIEKIKNGGYILAGGVIDGLGSSDVLAVRIDDNGNLVWQKKIGGSAEERACSVVEMPDNTFVFAGNSTSSDGNVPFNHGLTDGFAFALDDNGTLLWTKSYGGSFRDEFYGVTSGANGSVILSGFTGSSDGGVSGTRQVWDFVLLKLRNRQTKFIDTVSCKPLVINNILIAHDTALIDTLKDICNYDSAYIKHNVTIKSPETINTINDAAINFREKITLTTTASGPVTWIGTGLSCYTCFSPVTSPATSLNTYIVKTGSGNCMATDTVIISVKATDTLYVPSAFTPNGDGKNDVFNALGIVTDFSMSIYNRWGERIFKTNSLLTGWDGIYKGVTQPTGTFVYFIRYKKQSNAIKQLKGTFILIR